MNPLENASHQQVIGLVESLLRSKVMIKGMISTETNPNIWIIRSEAGYLLFESKDNVITGGFFNVTPDQATAFDEDKARNWSDTINKQGNMNTTPVSLPDAYQEQMDACNRVINEVWDELNKRLLIIGQSDTKDFVNLTLAASNCQTALETN